MRKPKSKERKTGRLLNLVLPIHDWVQTHRSYAKEMRHDLTQGQRFQYVLLRYCSLLWGAFPGVFAGMLMVEYATMTPDELANPDYVRTVQVLAVTAAVLTFPLSAATFFIPYYRGVKKWMRKIRILGVTLGWIFVSVFTLDAVTHLHFGLEQAVIVLLVMGTCAAATASYWLWYTKWGITAEGEKSSQLER
ncbi:MAG: hypothetical protein AAGJ10_09480 [Bacteroidota bacterium]